MKFRIVCMVLLLQAGYCRAGTNAIETIKANLEVATASLDKALETQKADALVSYGKALDSLMAALQQKGDLDGLVAVRNERKRFDAEKTIDEANSHAAVVLITIKKYRTCVARLERDRAVKGIGTMKQAISQLEALIKQQVMQGKIEEAQAAKEESETIKFVVADAESKLPPDESPKPTPRPAPAPSVVTPKPTPKPTSKPNAPEPRPAEPVTKKVVWEKHQYQVVLTKLSWHEAKEACEKAGGHLVIINNASENKYIEKLLAGRDAWIGCTDEVEEGTWLWVDGSKVTYAGWDPGPPEPNAAWDDEDYGVIRTSEGLWNDSQPGECGAYVCEWDR
jgi:Lectin C-type domain